MSASGSRLLGAKCAIARSIAAKRCGRRRFGERGGDLFDAHGIEAIAKREHQIVVRKRIHMSFLDAFSAARSLRSARKIELLSRPSTLSERTAQIPSIEPPFVTAEH